MSRMQLEAMIEACKVAALPNRDSSDVCNARGCACGEPNVETSELRFTLDRLLRHLFSAVMDDE